jgi:hypothetical protein
MSVFRCITRLLLAMHLLSALTILAGCMLVSPHHGQNAGARPEEAAEPHTRHDTGATESTTAVAATADKADHGHGAMSMMHGSGPWRWLVGGAMVVMMVLMVL